MLSRILAIVVLALIVPDPASANMKGRKPDTTPPVGEMKGVQNVAITHESLAIDLRPLVEAKPVMVDVTYHLDNTGDAQKLDLVFISGAVAVSKFEVWLDDRRVFYEATPATSDPPFALELPKGRHTLKVHYHARVQKVVKTTHPTVFWNFKYVLAPAREWASFGTLDVAVQAPPNWIVETTKLTGADGEYKGRFTGLPADEIVVLLRAPEGWTYPMVLYGTRTFFGFVCVGGFVACWWIGRRAGARGTGSTLFCAVCTGVAWGLATFGSGYAAIEGPDLEILLPPDQTYEYIGYGKVFALIGVYLLAILALILGTALTQFSANFAPRPSSPDRLGLPATAAPIAPTASEASR